MRAHRRTRLTPLLTGRLAVALVALGALAPLIATAASAGRATASTRPNFVIILADDLDARITPMWQAMPKSAALLRDEGMSFTNAFVDSPDCCPSRASLLLGQYPHNSGVYASDGDFGGWTAYHRNGDEEKTFAIALHDAGYRTALIGKYLNQYRQSNAGLAPPPGWDEWAAFINDTFYGGYSYTMNENGTLVSYGTSAADYSTDVVAAKATQFIDSAAQDPSRPFLAYVAPTAPHFPLTPPPRYASNPWSTATAPRLPSFYEADLSDKPSWLQISASYRDVWKPYVDTDYRNRMGSLLALDDLVASVITRLDQHDLLGNTYVVLTSDNGYGLGSHHLLGKLAPYEESVRVPLVIAGPGVVHGSDTHMVLLSDLAPTILELAGVQPRTTIDMRSLVPLLSATSTPTWRRDLLIERHVATAPGADPADYYLIGALYDMPSYAAVRTARYKFVEWYQQGELGTQHEYELYDLWNDPFELRNLLATSTGAQQHASIVAALTERLHVLMACGGTSCA